MMNNMIYDRVSTFLKLPFSLTEVVLPVPLTEALNFWHFALWCPERVLVQEHLS